MATSRPKTVSLRKVRKKRYVVIHIALPNFSWLKFTKPSRATVDAWSAYGLLLLGVLGIGVTVGPSLFSPHESSIVIAARPTTPTPVKKVGMSKSTPIHLDIPAIGVSTDLLQLGQNSDGSLAMPDDYDHAGWYQYSPTPGEVGPSIIAGHVDNYLGAAVFFNLKELQPGQPIVVQRQDGTSVTFKVDSVQLFDQSNFPTDEVYGNIDYPGLRLITCGGVFSPITGHYSHNIVVYATYDPAI